MIQKHTDIVIHGKYYSSTELMDFVNSQIQSKNTLTWGTILYDFIREWISDSRTIKVKTSGSTAKPKTILLEKEKMIQSALRTGSYLDLKKDDKALLCLPVDFIAGKMMVVRAFVLGLNIIPIKPATFPLELVNEKFDFAAMTPMQVSNIFRGPNGEKKLNNINKLIIGGGEVNNQLAEQISKLTNHTWNTYGMTETITHIALKKLNGIDKSNFFEAIPGVSFDKNERNCLIIHAHHLFSNPIATNDNVDLISKTEFDFIGRVDNIINTGGVKVSPESIEKKLESFIKIPFAISSISDKTIGEKVVLIMEGSANSDINLDKISEKAKLSKFEKPREIFIISKIPLTGNGKINRKNLIEKINIE